jgi:hypothetical protein
MCIYEVQIASFLGIMFGELFAGTTYVIDCHPVH